RLLERRVAAPFFPSVERRGLPVSKILGEDDRLPLVRLVRISHVSARERRDVDRRCEVAKGEAIDHSRPASTSGTVSGVTDSMKSSLIMIGVANPHAPRHSTSITVNLPSADVWPSSW